MGELDNKKINQIEEYSLLEKDVPRKTKEKEYFYRRFIDEDKIKQINHQRDLFRIALSHFFFSIWIIDIPIIPVLTKITEGSENEEVVIYLYMVFFAFASVPLCCFLFHEHQYKIFKRKRYAFIFSTAHILISFVFLLLIYSSVFIDYSFDYIEWIYFLLNVICHLAFYAFEIVAWKKAIYLRSIAMQKNGSENASV